MEKKLTRAEERALEAYPVDICGYTVECRVGAKPQPQDWNEIRRTHFQEGYEQAEKDIKEWVDEQLTTLDKQTLLHPDDDVFWGQRNAFKRIKDKINSL